MENLVYIQFKDVNLDDPFFDSLKQGYQEFVHWFCKKSNNYAYVFYNELGLIDGFLYLKKENNLITDTLPNLQSTGTNWLKIGTFKINAHGTKLGERFIKKVFDYAISYGYTDIYVTVFEEHVSLINIFKRYGFLLEAQKTTSNGTELVLCRRLSQFYPSVDYILNNYPLVNLSKYNNFTPNYYLLSLYPQWHSRLLPDSILQNEDASIVQDISSTNSIHKVYLAKMRGMEHLKKGDVLFIYRTNDGQGSAYYRALISSVCIVEEYRNISTFQNFEEFYKYCSAYCIFTDKELLDFWLQKTYPHIIRFSYNLALPKRVIRKYLLEDVGLNHNDYFGFLRLTYKQSCDILRLGQVHEGTVIY